MNTSDFQHHLRECARGEGFQPDYRSGLRGISLPLRPNVGRDHKNADCLRAHIRQQDAWEGCPVRQEQEFGNGRRHRVTARKVERFRRRRGFQYARAVGTEHCAVHDARIRIRIAEQDEWCGGHDWASAAEGGREDRPCKIRVLAHKSTVCTVHTPAERSVYRCPNSYHDWESHCVVFAGSSNVAILRGPLGLPQVPYRLSVVWGFRAQPIGQGAQRVCQGGREAQAVELFHIAYLPRDPIRNVHCAAGKGAQKQRGPGAHLATPGEGDRNTHAQSTAGFIIHPPPSPHKGDRPRNSYEKGGVSPAARGPGFARSRATHNVAQLRRATPADRCGRGLQRACAGLLPGAAPGRPGPAGANPSRVGAGLRDGSKVPAPCAHNGDFITFPYGPCAIHNVTGCARRNGFRHPVRRPRAAGPGSWSWAVPVGCARLGSLSPALASSLRRVGRLRRAFVGGSAPHTPTFSRGVCDSCRGGVPWRGGGLPCGPRRTLCTCRRVSACGGRALAPCSHTARDGAQ